MYLITKQINGAEGIVGFASNADSASLVAATNHPCRLWKIYANSLDILPLWDAERFERIRQNAGATGEESHE